MEVYVNMIKKIIEQQEKIIGPMAFEQARDVEGLTITDQKEVMMTGNPQAIIDSLVEKYKDLFGQISVEVSRDAVSSLLSMLDPQDIPKTLITK